MAWQQTVILVIIHLAGKPLDTDDMSFATDSQFGSCITYARWNVMIAILSFVLGT